MKSIVLPIVLLLTFAIPCHSKSEARDLGRVKALFSSYIEELTNQNRTEGNSVASAGDFYARLLDARINCEKARIVVLLREPKGSSLRYIDAHSEQLRRPMKNPLLWHSALAYEGHVFDTASKTYGQSIEEYFKTVWKPVIDRPDFKILAIQLKDLPFVAQSINNSVGSIGYELFSWQEFKQNPLLISQKINK